MLSEFVGNAVRNVTRLFEDAGSELEQHSALARQLEEAVAALHRSAASLEAHVGALEKVADSLPALTDAVTTLSERLSAALELAVPLEKVEQEVSGLGHLFRRRHPHD